MSNSREYLGSATVYLDHVMEGLPFNEWHPLEYNEKYQKKKEAVTGKVLLEIFWSEDDATPGLGAAAGEEGGVSGADLQSIRPFSASSQRPGAKAALPALPEDSRNFSSAGEESPPAPPGVVRKVVVTMVKAENLVAKDRNGLSDPFAEILLGQHKVCMYVCMYVCLYVCR